MLIAEIIHTATQGEVEQPSGNGDSLVYLLIGPTFTLLTALLVGILQNIFQARREFRENKRRDRLDLLRDQRNYCAELREVLRTWMASTVNIMELDRNSLQTSKKLERLPDELNAAWFQSGILLNQLTSKVLNPEVRNSIDILKTYHSRILVLNINRQATLNLASLDAQLLELTNLAKVAFSKIDEFQRDLQLGNL